jgi:hypothetical protein
MTPFQVISLAPPRQADLGPGRRPATLVDLQEWVAAGPMADDA